MVLKFFTAMCGRELMALPHERLDIADDVRTW